MPELKKKTKKRAHAGCSTKDDLLRASMELFGEHGYDGTSVRDIANKVGCNVSMIAFHFGGKEKLYKTVKRHLIDDVHAYLDEITLLFTDIQKRPLSLTRTAICLRGNLTMKLSETLTARIRQPLFMLLRKTLREGDKDSKELYSEVFIPMLNAVEKFLDQTVPNDIGRKNHLRAYVFIDTLIGIIRDMPLMAMVDKQEITNQDAEILADTLCDILLIGKKASRS